MDLETRFIKPGEMAAVLALLSDSFGFDPKEDDLERFERGFEQDRVFGTFDGDEMVGTGGAFSLHMTVPGAALATGGTTIIAVRPTHRRRGVLREMMRLHLQDVADHGEPLAALWASESSIYGRFGFGLASYMSVITVKRAHAEFRTAGGSAGRVRMVDAAEALPMLQRAYDLVVPVRPGMFTRSEAWWEDRRMHDPEHHRDGATAYRYAVYSEGDEPLGYVQYRMKENWESGHADGTVRVRELMAATPAATDALWRYLLGLDLMGTIEAWNRPVDDELRWLLTEPRRAESKPSDSAWVRVMDVVTAMESRRYSTPGGFVMEVTDEFLPAAGGVFKVEGGPGGAECRRTDQEPDFVLGASELGAVYLGGNRLSTLARAGRVHGDPTAIRRADLMLSWDPLPWCQEVF